MAQSVVIEQRGLHTYASPISGVPSGSLSVAENVNINREGIIEPRRGFDFLAYRLPSASDRAGDIVFWNGSAFARYGTAFAYYDSGSGFVSRGSLSRPSSSNHLSYVGSQNKNLYIASSTGIVKTDAAATSLYAAGVPKGLTIDLSMVGTTGTALEVNSYATYRYILGKKDANSNFHFGGVSGRFTIKNSGSDKDNVLVRCFLPSGIDTSFFIQLYKITTTTIPASDELQLCYERPIASADISAGYADITDIVPSDLVGATIYTAPSQQGLTSDNAVPPLARDIAEYKNHLFFADVESQQRLIFSLVSVGGTGLVSTDTVTIVRGAVTEVYTGGAAFNASTKTFAVSTASYSTSVNIDATIKSFIKCVNLASSIVSAYSLVQSEDSLPGKVMIESKALGASTFTVVSSKAAAFQPQLTSPATINNTSAADTFKNGLMYSKQFQPEAVPTKNVFKVGSSEDRILKIVPVREGMFILKEKDGAYILRGNSEFDFSVQLLDNTAKLVSAASVATVNNLVYGLFESGIMELTDTGATIISNPIKDQILPLLGSSMISLVKSLAFGHGNNIDGKYILSVPKLTTDTYTTKQIVFDTFGRSFTNWTMGITCGGVNPADSLTYLGNAVKNSVLVERKISDHTDFADYEAVCSVSSYNGTTVYISNTAGMAAGDIIYQGTTAIAYIESVSLAGGYVVVDAAQTWTTGVSDVIHLKAIDCKIQWNPDVGGNVAAYKQYYECALISKTNFQKTAVMYFSADSNPSESLIEIESPSGNGAFGQFAFGDGAFGGDQAASPKRIGVPRSHSRCSAIIARFENKVAFSNFEIEGISWSFNTTSTRVAR